MAEGALPSLGLSLAGRVGSSLLLLALWEAAARLAGSRLLPPASAVIAMLVAEAAHGPLLYHLGVTLARVAAAFVVAMAIGSALGVLMGRDRRIDLVLDSWVVLLLNLPALVVIVLAYVWFGLTEAAAVGAVAVNKIPMVAVTLREGARALEPDYAEMARSFRLPWGRRLRHVVLPQLLPYVLAAARSGLALIWKIVLVVELLGRSDGIGFLIQLYFQLFDVPRILACALAFVAVVQLIEWGVLQPLERRWGAWRQGEAARR
jgi:NitT/TauT family transport system permease protein